MYTAAPPQPSGSTCVTWDHEPDGFGSSAPDSGQRHEALHELVLPRGCHVVEEVQGHRVAHAVGHEHHTLVVVGVVCMLGQVLQLLKEILQLIWNVLFIKVIWINLQKQ